MALGSVEADIEPDQVQVLDAAAARARSTAPWWISTA
jgi:hypothetical protein